MNGTTAELWAKMAIRLKRMKITIMGASQKRLRTLRKSHNSFMTPILDISVLLKLIGIMMLFLDRPADPI